jgi:hypothetical protein
LFAINDEILLAIKFDVSIATAAAALWINGVQEIGVGGALVAGSGGSQTVDRVDLGSGGAVYSVHSDFIIYDDLTDDGTRTSLYVLPLDATDDVLTTGWTSTGANFFGEVNDFAVATYAQSTTDPTGDLELGLEERADVDAALTGGTYDAVAIYSWSRGEGALQAATIGIRSNGAAQTSARTLGITDDIYMHVSAVDPDTAAAWTGAALDVLTATISVT